MADRTKLRAYVAKLLSGGNLTTTAKRKVLSALVGYKGITVYPDGTVEIGLQLKTEVLRSTAINMVKKRAVSRRN